MVVYKGQQNKTSGINFIEVEILTTADPNQHLVMISPMKTSMVMDRNLINRWKMFEFVFSNPSTTWQLLPEGSTQIFVGFTSVTNAYGATADYLFDSQAIAWTQIYFGHIPVLKVTGFTQTDHLRPNCMEESFYECLESDLANSKVKAVSLSQSPSLTFYQE